MYPSIHIGPYTYYSFGVMLALAICAGCYAFSVYFKRHGLPVNMVAWGLSVIPVGLFAARVDDTVFHAFLHTRAGWSDYVAQIGNGGLTYYGGLTVSLLAFVVFIRVNQLPMLRTLDSLFCVGLAYAIGRVGCFLSGDGDYGVASNLPWAMSFPHGAVPTLTRVHPTMLYTTAYELIVFAVLWRMSSVRRATALPDGFLLGIYLVLTSVGRFLVEFLSRNRPVLLGLKEAQIVSLGLAAVGVGVLLLSARRKVSRRVDCREDGHAAGLLQKAC